MSNMTMPGTGMKRGVLVHPEHVRQVRGDEIVVGDVLVTGLVLGVNRNDIDGEVRLHLPGANIHYVDDAETVTVLARVTSDVVRAVEDAMIGGAR